MIVVSKELSEWVYNTGVLVQQLRIINSKTSKSKGWIVSLLFSIRASSESRDTFHKVEIGITTATGNDFQKKSVRCLSVRPDKDKTEVSGFLLSLST